jgi:hypothetical protein
MTYFNACVQLLLCSCRELVREAARSDAGVVLTTYEGLRAGREHLLDVRWGYAVLDEGHKIRNPDTEVTLVAKQLPTLHRWVSFRSLALASCLGCMICMQALCSNMRLAGVAMQLSTGMGFAALARDNTCMLRSLCHKISAAAEPLHGQ